MSRVIPSLNGLEAFEATARLGSVTRAAAELNLTQSAVSRHISMLEKRLGVALFLRRSKRLELSEAGASYLSEVRTSLISLQTATTSLIASRGRAGSLNVATLPTFGANWLVPRLHRFRARFPRIALFLVERPEPFDFAFDRVDCAIHFGQPNWTGATSRFLCGENLVTAASPTIAARVQESGTWRAETLIHVRARPFAWRDWAQFAGVDDMSFQPQISVDSFAMALAAARADLGIAVLPSVLIAPDLQTGVLQQISDASLPSQSSYYFVEPEGRGAPYAVQMFAEWLFDEAQMTES